MRTQPFYSFEGLFPPSEDSSKGYAFNAHITRDLARRLLDNEIDSKSLEKLNLQGKRIIERIELRGSIYDPYTTYKGKWLPHIFQVPGNACTLTMNQSTITKLRDPEEDEWSDYVFTYAPHNIDTQFQAFGLVMLFCHYMSVAESVNYDS